MVELIDEMERLEDKFFNDGWNEVDLNKYWLLAHKVEDVSPKITPMSYKVKALLRKFLNQSDSALPGVIRLTAKARQAIQKVYPSFDGGLVSFCFLYPSLRDMKDALERPKETHGVY